MGKNIRKIRIFVSSPSDVQKERESLIKVIEELNRVIGQEKNVFIELVRWETHIVPDMGRAQSVINRQIGPYEIFIGIMWKRFGTPTGKTSSGTQEEFESAYEYWKVTGSPRIMFYFNKYPYYLRTLEEIEQVRKLTEFRLKLQKKGLFWEYNGTKEFERILREHLNTVIREFQVNTKKRKLTKKSVSEPVEELFDNAYSEWQQYNAYASKDRLELFLQNKDKFNLTSNQLRFILESWFKSGEYSPEKYLNEYNSNEVLKICKEIINNEKDIDIVKGAIKVLGEQESDKCVEILLGVIENNNKYENSLRLIAIERFWFSNIKNNTNAKIADVLINILRNDLNYKLRKEAAYVLYKRPNKKVIKVLEEALKDSRKIVRENAANSLGWIRSTTSIKPLIDLLEKEKYSFKTRKKLVFVLGLFSDDKKARNVLETIATDNNEDTQIIQEAKWALERKATE